MDTDNLDKTASLIFVFLKRNQKFPSQLVKYLTSNNLS